MRSVTVILFGCFLVLLAACSSGIAVFTDDMKEPVVPVDLPPHLPAVPAPEEIASEGRLMSVDRGGTSLQYYALEADADRPVAFLTFDGFGSGANLSAILGLLDDYGAKATFFVNCRQIDPENSLYSDKHVRRIRRLQRYGHTIANHSYSHFSSGTYWYNYYRQYPIIRSDGSIKLPPNSAAQAYTYQYGYLQGLEYLRDEIDACDNLMNSYGIHRYDPIFRPPYGENVPLLGTALAQAGYSAAQVLNWDVGTCDFASATTAEEIRDAIVDGVMPSACAEGEDIVTRPLRHGDIILLHWPIGNDKNTVEGLRLALEELSGEFLFPALQHEARDF